MPPKVKVGKRIGNADKTVSKDQTEITVREHQTDEMPKTTLDKEVILSFDDSGLFSDNEAKGDDESFDEALMNMLVIF